MSNIMSLIVLNQYYFSESDIFICYQRILFLCHVLYIEQVSLQMYSNIKHCATKVYLSSLTKNSNYKRLRCKILMISKLQHRVSPQFSIFMVTKRANLRGSNTLSLPFSLNHPTKRKNIRSVECFKRKFFLNNPFWKSFQSIIFLYKSSCIRLTLICKHKLRPCI